MLFKIVVQRLTHCLIHSTTHFTVTQFGLSLAFKLRFRHLHRDDSNQSLTEILTRNLNLSLFKCLGTVIICILFQHTGQCHTETRLVRTTLLRINIVNIRVKILTVAGIVHNCTLDRYATLFSIQIDDIVEEGCIVAIEEAHKLLHTLFAMKRFFYEVTLLILLTKVGQRNANPFVQVSQFTQTGLKGRILIFGRSEN